MISFLSVFVLFYVVGSTDLNAIWAWVRGGDLPAENQGQGWLMVDSGAHGFCWDPPKCAATCHFSLLDTQKLIWIRQAIIPVKQNVATGLNVELIPASHKWQYHYTLCDSEFCHNSNKEQRRRTPDFTAIRRKFIHNLTFISF